MKKFSQNTFSKLLKQRLQEQVPKVKAEIQEILKNHSDKQVDTLKVDHIIMGMKELPLLFYPCSSLDPSEGIRFRGLSIPEMQQQLPKINNEPIPESVFWLLMTGEIPNQEQLQDLRNSLTEQVEIPTTTKTIIDSHAKSHHPMTVLSMALLDLQTNSKSNQAQKNGNLNQENSWLYFYDDAIEILKVLPLIAARIYTEKYNKTPNKIVFKDWAGVYCNLLGYEEENLAELLRGYLAIHTDHEGGNISAHAAYLASSGNCDGYLSLVNAVNGLAGPLHGLANQEVLKFLLKMKDAIKQAKLDHLNPQEQEVLDFIRNYVQTWLKTSVIPGYGHGRLRTTDPRYTHLKNLSQTIMPDHYLIQLVHASEPIITEVLTDLGKVKNPNPNVDAHSGVLLYELGLTQFEYYTVVFAVSRAMGVFANTVWARALQLPMERGSSIDTSNLKQKLNLDE